MSIPTEMVRAALRQRARKNLDELFCPKATGDAAVPNLKAAQVPVWQLTLDDIADFHVGCQRGTIDLKAHAQTIRWHEEALRAFLRDEERLPVSADERQQVLGRLSCYIAAVFVPAVACLGEYGLSVPVASDLIDRCRGPAHRDVLGAGDSNAEYRLLVLLPVIWSLAIHHPEGDLS